MRTTTPHAWVPLAILSLALGFGSSAYAQDEPNQITFVNQSGTTSLVKLVGPSPRTVSVPNGTSQTVHVARGGYYTLVRYGNPSRYRYTRGEHFTVRQTETECSIITITLHAVEDGNYESRPSSRDEFEGAD